MNWLLHNFWIKLLAVVMAFLLWFHVATEKEYEVELAYNLVFEGIAEDLILSTPPPSKVAVRCRSSGKNLLPLLFKERIWRIGLVSYAAGSTEIELSAQDVPHYDAEEVEFTAIVQPSQIRLDIDRVDQKTVPIVHTFIYEPHEGYLRVGPESVRPDSVILTGPASTLKDLTQVRARERVFNNLTDPVDEKVDLEPLTAYNVTRNVEDCRLFADVQPYAEKAFTGIPIIPGPWRDADQLALEPDSVSVIIGGGRRALGLLDSSLIHVYLDTVTIDSFPVYLGLALREPAGFRAVSVRPESVLVRLR